MAVVGQAAVCVANKDKHEARNPKQIKNSNVSKAAPWGGWGPMGQTQARQPAFLTGR
jgi:hypothetical protein